MSGQSSVCLGHLLEYVTLCMTMYICPHIPMVCVFIVRHVESRFHQMHIAAEEPIGN